MNMQSAVNIYRVNYPFYKMYQPINKPEHLYLWYPPIPACPISQSKRFTRILLVPGQHIALISLSCSRRCVPRAHEWRLVLCSLWTTWHRCVWSKKADGEKGQHLHQPPGCHSAQLCSCGPHTVLQETHTHHTTAVPRWHSSWGSPVLFWSTDLCCCNTAVPAQTKLV